MRGKSVLAICKFGIYKVRIMLVSWILLIFSILMFSGLIIFLFLKSSNIDDLVSNFHYGVLIFINIFLLLFILLIIIKVYGREFNDGIFLLLLSRPYRRFEIFLFKVLTVWFLILIFIGLNMGAIVGVAYLMNLFLKNSEFLNRCLTLVLPLFLFSLVVSFISSSGFIFISTILSTQTVLLIGFIFCSLFLLGGMPYSLITQIANNKEVSFEQSRVEQSYSIAKLKEIYLFNNKINKEKEFKYFNLTKKIYDYYSNEEMFNMDVLEGLLRFDTNKIEENKENQIEDKSNQTDYIELRKKRLNFYSGLNLTKELEFIVNKENILNKVNEDEDFKDFSIDKDNLVNKDPLNDDKDVNLLIENWPGSYDGQKFEDIKDNYESIELKEFKVSMPLFFINKDELIKNDPIHSELLDIIEEYLSQTKFKTYAQSRLTNITSLLYFNEDDSYYTFNVKGEKSNLDEKQKVKNDHKQKEDTKWFDIISSLLVDYFNTFNASPRVALKDPKHQKAFADLVSENFNNPVLFILENLESNILRKIYDYKIITNSKVKKSNIFSSYISLMNVYQIISSFNLIEHVNQLWTSSIKENLYGFVPFYQSTIEFDNQKNYLMSYQDFGFNLDKSNKLVISYRSIPALYLLIIYVGSAFLLLILTYLLLIKKSIT